MIDARLTRKWGGQISCLLKNAVTVVTDSRRWVSRGGAAKIHRCHRLDKGTKIGKFHWVLAEVRTSAASWLVTVSGALFVCAECLLVATMDGSLIPTASDL